MFIKSGYAEKKISSKKKEAGSKTLMTLTWNTK